MKKRTISTFILALTALMAAAQKTVDLKELTDQVKQQRIALDSTSKNLDATMNNMNRKLDSMRKLDMQKQAERNGEMMLRWHNERQAKKKKQMFLYLGLLFMAVFVVGILRSRKKTN
jgi:hypothetical protein